MHEYFRQIWHIFKMYCPYVPCGQHLWKPETFALRVYRNMLRLLSHAMLVAFTSSHIQSLYSWREAHLPGLYRNFAAAFSSQTARPLQIILAVFRVPTWQLLTGCLLPGACMLLLQAAPCPGRCCPLGRTDLSPDGWESTFLTKAGVCCLDTPKKNFPLHLPGSGLGLALTGPTQRFPPSTRTPVCCSADPFLLLPITHRHSRDSCLGQLSAKWRRPVSPEPLGYPLQASHKNNTQKSPGFRLMHSLQSANVHIIPTWGYGARLSCL